MKLTSAGLILLASQQQEVESVWQGRNKVLQKSWNLLKNKYGRVPAWKKPSKASIYRQKMLTQKPSWAFNKPTIPKPSSSYEWTEWIAARQICLNGKINITRDCRNKYTGNKDNTKCLGISERTEPCSIENMKMFSMNNFVHNQQPNNYEYNETDYFRYEDDFDNNYHIDFDSSNPRRYSRKKRAVKLTNGVNGHKYSKEEQDFGYVSMNGMSYAEPLGNRKDFSEKIDDDTYSHSSKDALKIKEGSEDACCKELYTCGDAAVFYKSGRYQFLGLNHEDKAIYTKNDKHYISAMQGSWQLTGDITSNSITSFLYNNNYGNQCPTFSGNDWKNWNNDDQKYFTSGCAVDVKRHIFDCGMPFELPKINGNNGKEYIEDVVSDTTYGYNDGNFSEDDFEAVPHSYPWQVSVRAGAHFCGGALIRPDWIVTAAHCAYYFKNWGFSVMVGEHDVNSGNEENQEQACIEKIYLHPKYDKAQPDKGNDIAIVKLAWPVKLNAHVLPICMADKEFKIQDDDFCTVTGWGKTDPMVDLKSGKLQQARVKIMNSDACAYDSKSILCAGDNLDGACKGDSGGPLQCYRPSEGKWYLVGLTSFSIGNNNDIKCAAFGYPSMYTRISHYSDWIIGGMSWHGDEDAIFSNWSDWSTCSAECGSSGISSRTRTCSGSGSCIGDTYEEKECNKFACMEQCNINDIPFHDDMVNWHYKTACAKTTDGMVAKGKVCSIVCDTGSSGGDFYPAYRGSTEIKKVRCQCTQEGCGWVPPMRQQLFNPPLQCLASAKCAHPAIAFERLKDPALMYVNSAGEIIDPAYQKTISAAVEIFLKCPANKVGGADNEVVDPIVSNIATKFTCKSISTEGGSIRLFLPFPQRELIAAQICPGDWSSNE